jgi:signal transduction histidine kinase
MNFLASDPCSHRRVLVVDDNTAIHDDFRKILAADESDVGEVDAEAAALFGGDPAASAAPAAGDFALEFAPQGQEALARARAARAAGRPFALAFVDMRMPPGWDGLTTILELWKADPEIQTVICTAYSDRSWEDIQAALTARDRWLVLKKPFDRIEVLQLANSLTEKWKLARLAATKLELLEELVAARTRELVAAHRVKGEFLTNASHELLTPMNGVAGFLELLDTTPLNAEQADFVREAQSCGRRLHTLIRQLFLLIALDLQQNSTGLHRMI